MQFIRSENASDGGRALVERLQRELAAGHKVLWLTSGGSNIPISVDVMRQLEDDLTKNLGIMPADERYGPVGHADSNLTQLLSAGFEAKKAKLLPVLQTGLSLEAAATYFDQLMQTALQKYE